MVLWRRREADALEHGGAAHLLRLGHVDVRVHAGAVLVRVVVARARLRRGRRAVVPAPVDPVAQLSGREERYITSECVASARRSYSPRPSSRTSRARSRTSSPPALGLPGQTKEL